MWASRCMNSELVAHGLSCLTAHGIFLHQRPNPCPQHWQAGFLSTKPPRQSPDCILETPPVTDTLAASTLLQPRGLSSEPSAEPTVALVRCGHLTGLFSPSGSCPLLTVSSHKLRSDAVPPAVSAFSLLELSPIPWGLHILPGWGVRGRYVSFW